MPGGQVIGIHRHKYAVLLALLVVGLAVATFTAQSGLERLRSDAVRTVLGVAIWIVVFERPRERRIMAAVLFAFLALNLGPVLRRGKPRSRNNARAPGDAGVASLECGLRYLAGPVPLSGSRC